MRFLRLALGALWLAGVTWFGGAVGVMIARSKESGDRDMATITRELAVRQDHFMVGLGIGLAIAVAGLVSFWWWNDRRRKRRRTGDG